jgi:hypothetical protein
MKGTKSLKAQNPGQVDFSDEDLWNSYVAGNLAQGMCSKNFCIFEAIHGWILTEPVKSNTQNIYIYCFYPSDDLDIVYVVENTTQKALATVGLNIEDLKSSIIRINELEIIEYAMGPKYVPEFAPKPPTVVAAPEEQMVNPFEGDEMFKEASHKNEEVLQAFINKQFSQKLHTPNLAMEHFHTGWGLLNYDEVLAYVPEDNPNEVYYNGEKYSPTTTQIQSHLHYRLDKAYKTVHVVNREGMVKVLGPYAPPTMKLPFQKKPYKDMPAQHLPPLGQPEPEMKDPFKGDPMFTENTRLIESDLFLHEHFVYSGTKFEIEE